jgi:hypothetical protein
VLVVNLHSPAEALKLCAANLFLGATFCTLRGFKIGASTRALVITVARAQTPNRRPETSTAPAPSIYLHLRMVAGDIPVMDGSSGTPRTPSYSVPAKAGAGANVSSAAHGKT